MFTVYSFKTISEAKADIENKIDKEPIKVKLIAYKDSQFSESERVRLYCKDDIYSWLMAYQQQVEDKFSGHFTEIRALIAPILETGHKSYNLDIDLDVAIPEAIRILGNQVAENHIQAQLMVIKDDHDWVVSGQISNNMCE